MKWRVLWLSIVTLLIAASCGSGHVVSDSAGLVRSGTPSVTSTTQLASAQNADASLLIWNQAQVVSDGVELPPVGLIDPGVLISADFDTAGPSETTSRLLMTACRNPAPGRWIIDGTLRGQGALTFVVDVDQLIEDQIVGHTVELTFSGPGDFSFPYVPIWSEAPGEPLRALGSDGGVSSCSFSSDLPVIPVRSQRYEEIPPWVAPEGSIQGYPLYGRLPESSDLSRSVSAAVWFGTEIPFASLLLPVEDIGWGGLQVSNTPECQSAQYKTISSQIEVSVQHSAGGCVDNWPKRGPIEGHPEWNWIESAAGFARARLTLGTGVVDVFGPSDVVVVDALTALRQFDNKTLFEIAGPTSADEAIAAQLARVREIDPNALLTLRARVETENMVAVAYTSVRPATCNGCSGDELGWMEILVEERSGIWFLRGGGGNSWDECLGISAWSSAGQIAAQSALAGQPDWTIEGLRDGTWVPLETKDGYWIELGDGTQPAGLPTVRTLDADGRVQACAASNLVPTR